MADGDPEGGRTAIGRALALLGDRWVLLILHRAFALRIRTYAGFRNALPISESVLAGRLKEMVVHGIFTLRPYHAGRTRYEYRLTSRGIGLWSLLVAIYSWERAWSGSTFPVLVHDLCGQEARPYLACGRCGEPMSARDSFTVPGPDATFAGAGPPRQHRRTARADGDRGDGFGSYTDSMEILGDRWSTTVLAAAFLGTRRFVDFQTRLGIAPSVLTDRLRRFAELGVFRLESGDYRLTDKGLAFFAVFAFLVDWAQRELAAPPGSGLTITHRPCGAALSPILLCTACTRPLERTQIHFEQG
jgi:DNA-binding HxlR family transcriptional regulator